MSGGYFDYNQYVLNDIATKIEEIIASNDSVEKDSFGQDIGYHFRPETISKFKEAVSVLRKAEAMAQRVDWLISCDDGEDSFDKRWNEELAKLDAQEIG